MTYTHLARILSTAALVVGLAVPASAQSADPPAAPCPGPSTPPAASSGLPASTVPTDLPTSVKKVRFSSLDGRITTGLLATPSGPGPFPAVVFVHGGFGVDPKSDTVRKIASAGFVAFDPDYRDGDIGGAEVDDAVAAARYLKSLKTVAADRVGVMGTSHGGAIAILAAERYPTEFRALAAAASATDWACIWQIKEAEGDALAAGLERSAGGTPQTAWAEYVRRSPVYHVADIAIPAYLTHSITDPQVPVGQSENLAAALQAAGRTVTWRPTTTRGHGFLMVQPASGPDWQGVLSFLRSTLSAS